MGEASTQRAATLGDAPPDPAADRMARQLHDGALQLVSLALQELNDSTTSDAHRVRELLIEALQEMRGLLHHPNKLLPASSATDMLTQWGRLTLGPKRQVEVQLAPDASHLHHLVYETARELISNAAKHSACVRVSVRLRRTPTGWLLEVSDDGHGMGSLWEPGYGLTELRGRVTKIGGTVDHRPARPQGTRVLVHVPPALVHTGGDHADGDQTG